MHTTGIALVFWITRKDAVTVPDMANVLEALRRRRADRSATVVTGYWTAVEELAGPGRKRAAPKPDQIEEMLRAAGRSLEDLEADVTLVRELLEAEREAGDEQDAVRRREARRMHAEAVEAFATKRAELERALREEGEKFERQRVELAADEARANEARSAAARARKALAARRHGAVAVHALATAERDAANATTALRMAREDLAAVEHRIEDLEVAAVDGGKDAKLNLERMTSRLPSLRSRVERAELALEEATAERDRLAASLSLEIAPAGT